MGTRKILGNGSIWDPKRSRACVQKDSEFFSFWSYVDYSNVFYAPVISDVLLRFRRSFEIEEMGASRGSLRLDLFDRHSEELGVNEEEKREKEESSGKEK